MQAKPSGGGREGPGRGGGAPSGTLTKRKGDASKAERRRPRRPGPRGGGTERGVGGRRGAGGGAWASGGPGPKRKGDASKSARRWRRRPGPRGWGTQRDVD